MTQDELAALDRAATQQGDGNALTDLEIALVNLLRAGRIAVIDDGAVDALVVQIGDLAVTELDIDDDDPQLAHFGDRLRAALAALGVKP
jgi:hypothetical protein